MDEVLTYWQKFININNILIREEILLKRLLFFGYIDFHSFFQEVQKQITHSALLKIFEDLANSGWITTLIKLTESRDNQSEFDYNFLFRMISPKFVSKTYKGFKVEQ